MGDHLEEEEHFHEVPGYFVGKKVLEMVLVLEGVHILELVVGLADDAGVVAGILVEDVGVVAVLNCKASVVVVPVVLDRGVEVLVVCMMGQ